MLAPIICEHCGEDLTGIGLIGYINHPCNITKAVIFTMPTDSELREAFMELSMPEHIYEVFDFAKPTEMEKKIYEDNSRFK